MTKYLDFNEYVFCQYAGYIVYDRGKSIGLAPQRLFRVETFLPRSQVKRITYEKAGDSTEIRRDERIIAIELPRWLGRDKGLLGDHD